MDVLDQAPAWLLRPLPAHATRDETLHASIAQLSAELPDSLYRLHLYLDRVRVYREYDAAANHASACVWQALERFFASDLPVARRQLLDFAQAHMVEEAKARICRRLAKDPHARV